MTNPMTPTEQDKELLENSFGEWLENHGVELIGNNPSHLGTWQAMVDMNELKLAIMQLFTADGKRVELGARIDELNNVRDMDLSLVSHHRVIDRIAELKAQQEEV